MLTQYPQNTDPRMGMLLEPWNGRAQAACVATCTPQMPKRQWAGLVAAHLHWHPQILNELVWLASSAVVQPGRQGVVEAAPASGTAPKPPIASLLLASILLFPKLGNLPTSSVHKCTPPPFLLHRGKKKPSISSQKTHASHQIPPQSDLIINPVFTCTVHSCPTISPPHTNLLPFSRCPPPSTLPFRFQAPEEEEKETAPTAN
jgi:hypothetical protein